MPLDLDGIVERREKIEWGIAVACMLVTVLVLPRPEIREVNGQREAVIVAFGWSMPRWAQIAGLGVVLLLYHQLMVRIGRRIFPIKIAAQEIHSAPDMGVNIAWIPDEPGTPSPMAYTPWVPTSETTAAEFLTADPPNPMRAMMIGDAWDEENDAFIRTQEEWLLDAPEATLRNLIQEAEGITQGMAPRWAEEVVGRLVLANDIRGIPSRAEIRALIERRAAEGIVIDIGFDEE